jgi:hypothetical protein
MAKHRAAHTDNRNTYGVVNVPTPGHQYEAHEYLNGVESSGSVGNIGFPSLDDATIFKVLKKAAYVPASMSSKSCRIEHLGLVGGLPNAIKLYCRDVPRYVFLNAYRSLSYADVKRMQW